jgi:protein TIF31
VNKSNRNTFDPTPAANPFFAHDLFGTICGYSQQVRTAWTTLCEVSSSWFTGSEPGALDGLIRTFVDMKVDETAFPAGSWIAPTSNAGSDNTSQAKASYDVYRVQQSLTDLYGVEELGAPREWNDEIQSVRLLQAQDDNEKIMKARLEYKIITEFSESCKKLVMAVADGQIAPLTYGVPNESEVYSYNGIFVSRAEDIKDAFHIYEGEEAARKANSRDLANQKLIRTLEIEGLGSVLCTLVDYKGTRYIAQSVIPGILAQGESGARLMYGIMEENKPITVRILWQTIVLFGFFFWKFLFCPRINTTTVNRSVDFVLMLFIKQYSRKYQR